MDSLRRVRQEESDQTLRLIDAIEGNATHINGTSDDDLSPPWTWPNHKRHSTQDNGHLHTRNRPTSPADCWVLNRQALAKHV